jgi:ubiquinone biosynthesis monooxygenase Coq7
MENPDLEDPERQLSAALMRVNHTGEVCAQALYQGQAMTARDEDTRQLLEEAAREETDHLAWTERRIEDLGGSRSILNPAFYAGSFVLGALSGLAGDRWNLGFLAETERQVESHLRDHLSRLPPADLSSRRILEVMQEDEARHARTAMEHGGEEFPPPLKLAMKLASRLMTAATFRL